MTEIQKETVTERNRQGDRQTYIQTDRQTDIQKDT